MHAAQMYTIYRPSRLNSPVIHIIKLGKLASKECLITYTCFDWIQHAMILFKTKKKKEEEEEEEEEEEKKKSLRVGFR